MRPVHRALSKCHLCQVLALRLLHRLGRPVRQGAHLGLREQGAHPEERVPADKWQYQGLAVVQRQSADHHRRRGQGKVRISGLIIETGQRVTGIFFRQ